MKIRRFNEYNANAEPDSKVIAVDLEQSTKLFPAGVLNKAWDMYQLYLKEREACDQIRLICSVRPLCTNVLFNPVTEIVKDEGSPNAVIMNFNPGLTLPNTLQDRASNNWTEYEAIRDTQPSNPINGFTYNCGLDIFNNHILRTKTFKQVNLTTPATQTQYFNTIDDIGRNVKGEKLQGITDSLTQNTPILNNQDVFLYNEDNSRTFFESIIDNLKESNGWFGFINKTQVPNIELLNNGKLYHQVINDITPGTFIDMYPGQKLFSFTPIYNSFRQREEKNWNYCVTYPYAINTKIDVIDQTTKGLKAVYFDDKPDTIDNALTIYSICKHGLKVGDHVNIYVNGEPTYRGVQVLQLGDGYKENEEYAFSVGKQQDSLCNNWIDLTTLPSVVDPQTNAVRFFQIDTVSGQSYTGTCFLYQPETPWKVSGFTAVNNVFTPTDTNIPVIKGKKIPYPLNSTGDHVNSIPTISYKKVVDGCECMYYAQMLRRVPNWKHTITPIECGLKNESDIVEYTRSIYEFASQNTKLAYANTIYSDDVSQFVFTDDIDLNGLLDHFSRPLTEINLTIIKNNAGYREWYGTKKNSGYYPILTTAETIPDTVEFSHCFGPLCCAYKNSEESDFLEDSIENVRLSHSKYNALPIDSIINSENHDKLRYQNEICSVDNNFYGDICCFSPAEYLETHISPCYVRFNTAQRELTAEETPLKDTGGVFSTISYDEFVTPEPTSTTKRTTETITESLAGKGMEGYYYQMHQPIMVHGYSDELELQYPKQCDVETISWGQGNITTPCTLTTKQINYYQINDNITIAFITSGETYYAEATVTSIENNYRSCELSVHDSWANIRSVFTTIDKMKLLKADVTIPAHAIMLKDDSFRYAWRDFVKNGIRKSLNPQEWVFTNNRFYVEHDFNFFLHRQDPTQERLGTPIEEGIGDPQGKRKSKAEDNSYYTENEITCSFSTTIEI